MLILIAVLLSLLPAVAIAYPFVARRLADPEQIEDESSPQAELERRWDNALAALKNAELEWTIGNLSDEDHQRLVRQYMTEAALVIKAMDLEEQQEAELLASVDEEVRRVSDSDAASADAQAGTALEPGAAGERDGR